MLLSQFVPPSPLPTVSTTLEPIVQSEVSHKEKNKYHILTHIYGIEKDGSDEPICRGYSKQVAQTHSETEHSSADSSLVAHW